MARIYELMQADIMEGSASSDELEVLSLVKEYEVIKFPMPSPLPLEAIKFRMDQMGMSEKELGDILSTVHINLKFCRVKENSI